MLHLSDIDMIDGTPVLDIKPYIPDYDSPDKRTGLNVQLYESNSDLPAVSGNTETSSLNLDGDSKHAQFNTGDKRTTEDDDDDSLVPPQEDRSEADVCCEISLSDDARGVLTEDICSVLQDVRLFVTQDDSRKQNKVSDCSKPSAPPSTTDHPCYGEEDSATIANWIREPPVACLDVRLTPQAEKQLADFLPAHLSGKTKINSSPIAHLCLLRIPT